MATRLLLADLVPRFEATSDRRVSVESVGGVEAARRVRAGEAFDAIVLASGAIDGLMAAGRALPDSRVDLAKSAMAVAVRAGAPRPDIGSEEAVRRAVLSARRVGHSTGPSGAHLRTLLDRWGLAGELQDRVVQAPPGVPVGTLVARGEVDLGFQQLCELTSVSGVDVLGPLPLPIQHVTTFSGAIGTRSTQPERVRALLAFLASPSLAGIKRQHGMDEA
jgi:molybdate transport system substrate-binding protein